MRTLVRDFSRDQKDTIKGMFTDDEWDTSREVSKPDTSKSFPDRYDSYEEYTDALHDFLNGI